MNGVYKNRIFCTVRRETGKELRVKVPNDKGLPNHIVPESCVRNSRKARFSPLLANTPSGAAAKIGGVYLSPLSFIAASTLAFSALCAATYALCTKPRNAAMGGSLACFSSNSLDAINKPSVASCSAL